MRVEHKGTYLTIRLERQKFVEVKGENWGLGYKLIGDGSIIKVRGPISGYETIRGMTRLDEGMLFVINLLVHDPIRIEGETFYNSYADKKPQRYLSYTIFGPHEMIKDYYGLLRLYYKLFSLLEGKEPSPLNIEVQDLRAFPPMSIEFIGGAYYLEINKIEPLIVIPVMEWNRPERALAHELGHHIYKLLPREKKKEVWREWDKMMMEGKYPFLTEGYVLKGCRANVGHPWDEAEEMLASAMTIYLFQQYAINQESSLLAEEILWRVLGFEGIKIIENEWWEDEINA